MPFNSTEFVLFLLLVLSLYCCLPRAGQNIFLLAASYIFYGFYDWRFCGLLLFVTVLNFYCGAKISTATSLKKVFLLLGVMGNLAVLAVFKYYNFFISSLVDLFTGMGLALHFSTIHIILPIGISFYTLQAMGYIIDIYRGDISATDDFFAFAAFVSFFPQLLAGPIERARHMLPQFQNKRSLRYDKIYSGLVLILLGMFKKIAIADVLANDVNTIFMETSTAPWPKLLCCMWSFTIQIYCDFSGYSDIARGVARLFGFDIIINFNQPYFAKNISDFWRRWHISLSNWLRDYLYIPLGGGRSNALYTYRNLMLTMLLCGLWHGAQWTFILWGALHGIYLCFYRWFRQRNKKGTGSRRSYIFMYLEDISAIIITFNLVALGWIFFRAENVLDAFSLLGGIVGLRGSFYGNWYCLINLACFALLVLIIDIPQYLSGEHAVIIRFPWFAQGLIVSGMIILMILLAPGNEAPFIYFQF